MRTPKRDISKSGLRSWLRRHPVHTASPTLLFVLRRVYAKMQDDVVAVLSASVDEYDWFNDAPRTPEAA